MKRVLLLFGLLANCLLLHAQGGTNKMKAHYRLTKDKLAWMEAHGFYLSSIPKPGCCDAKPAIPIHHAFGDREGPLKMLVVLKDGVLLVDPWSIMDDVNMNKSDVIDSLFVTSFLSKRTPAVLQINIKRDNLGQGSHVIRIPYRAWVLSLNSIGVKVRPSASDSAGKNYSSNVSTGFNLGLTAGYSFGCTSFTHRTQVSWSHTLGMGLAFSAASLSKEPLIAPIDASATPSNLVLSPNFSYTFARNDVGLVLAAGLDQMIGSHADSWLYQNRFFWGFGLSVGLKV